MATKSKETEEVIEKTEEVTKEAEEVTKETEKAAETTQEKKDDRVEIFIPRGADVLISVNMKSFLLPAGKSSRVPKYIAEEYYRSQRAMAAYDEKSAELQELAKNPR